MEISSVTSPRMRSDHLEKEGLKETHGANFELESSHDATDPNHRFHSMNALEILRETVRILRYNCSGFMIILALFICPLSAMLMSSNLIVGQSIVKSLTVRLMLAAETSGVPLRPFIKQSCQHFAETAVSSVMCFPLLLPFALLSKAAVVYCVDCTYLKESPDASKFFVIIRKLWKPLVSTYLWMSMVIVGCVTTFFVFLVVACNLLSAIGFSPDIIVYAMIMMGLVFSIVFANAIVVCNVGIVICVLEEVSGIQALVRAFVLIKAQAQVGMLIFLGSTIGLTFVTGLFDHRVKTLSYGDGSSRIWEGPLLVVMFSFVMLIDSIMSTVFYFSCRSHAAETSAGER
ncbi:hypothetical protein F3Y22_tig00003041pilonHSYRG00497 [Hibiscus syriacus]|uniref:Son of sevenless n=1 Tax=Hibiscus syriacus TaxID=106335 RepID=A0A6A3CR28_HIBSY|nr:uncharacterized protein LOC120169367 [Hibiscus syriacus]KAE8730002.1 hypothetical protein F3Y22_tig00003041pilonHSYRG00497 [Hibiscus syriacus]